MLDEPLAAMDFLDGGLLAAGGRGSAVSYLTCFSAKLDRMLATPLIFVRPLSMTFSRD